MRRILSIDGGGERGVVPCTILAAIEAESGKPIAQLFDMLAGTSTGAILIACLKKGVPAKDILNIYQSEAKTIFNRGWHRSVLDIFGLIDSKYPATGIESVLDKYLGDELIGTEPPFMLIPSLHVKCGCPRFFKSDTDPTVKLSYAARCSSAAPTYFPSKDGMVDGGLFANNPAMCALAEGYKLWNDEPIKMLSIGTGYTTLKSVPQNGGLLKWATAITNLFMTGEMGYADYQAQYVLGDANYLRIQGLIPAGINESLDDTNPVNIQKLIQFAQTQYQQNIGAIQKLLLTN